MKNQLKRSAFYRYALVVLAIMLTAGLVACGSSDDPIFGNTAPVADAGFDQYVTTGTEVTLDGSGSWDLNGDTVTYSWTITSQPGTATLSGATSSSPTFTPDADGTYTIVLVVYDGQLYSASDSVTVIASSTGNSAPVASAGIDQSVTIFTLVTLDGSGSSDADGDTLTYLWTIDSQPGTATLSDATALSPTFTPDAYGTYTISLVVNDGTVDSAADTMTVTASSGNSAPVASAGYDQSVTTGTLVTLDGSASTDPELDSLTYSWTIDSQPGTATLSDPTAMYPTFTPDVDGTYTISLVVNDGTVDSPADSVVITASTASPTADTFYFQGTTYTESGSDPLMIAAYDSVETMSIVALLANYDTLAGTYQDSFTLGFGGQSVGTYTGVDTNIAMYIGSDGSMYIPDDGTNTSISIDVTQYDGVGGRIKGTYTATLCEFLAFMSGTCDNPLNRMTYTGSFDVTRELDQ